MSDPMYDDVSIENQKEIESSDLIYQLRQYIIVLEEYVIRLRKQVNRLADKGKEPFPDPASDFCIRFCDHPLYEKYSEIFDNENLDWKIID